MPFSREQPRRQKRGTRVYDENGRLFAESVSAAARRLGCRPNAMALHTAEHADGVQLISRPHGRRKCLTCGQSGGDVGGEYACPTCARPRLHDDVKS